MSRPRVIAARLLGLFGHKRLEQELDAEVRFHLEMQIDDNVRSGMRPDEARAAALRSFGGIEPMKENYRERSALSWLETTLQDVRYASRTLRKSPGYTLTCVATLALAIGANTAMFSVLNAVLLRPLPYHAPEELAMLWSEIPNQQAREARSAYLNIEEWRKQSQTFADMAFFDPASVTLTNAGEAKRISITRVSPNYFQVIGVQPLHGHTFTAEEAEQRQRLAIISHSLWQSSFGGSLQAIGATIELDGLPSRVIGIMPAGFESAGDTTAVWEPHTLLPDWDASRASTGAGIWFVLGRLRPGVTIAKAQSEMDAIARRLDEKMPVAEKNRGISVVPLSLQVTGPRQRLVLWMLAGAVFFVLLIAATNVASLSLARSATREKEISVRSALGATNSRIMRQLLAESITLSVVSGVVGLLVAHISIRLILAFKPGGLNRIEEVSLDPTVLACALGLCLLTGILVGLAPAITSARRNFQLAARNVAGGVASTGIRRVLVISEFALAITLLAGAGLLVRSLWSAQNVYPGFRSERILLTQISSPRSWTNTQRTGFYNRLLEQVQSLPGVEDASLISEIFIGGNPERIITTEGDGRTLSERMRFRSDEASPAFFSTLRAPLISGRFFSASDGTGPPVAIINETMARRLWNGRDPVGRRFKFGAAQSSNNWFTVVGVVGDMRRQGLESEPIPQMFEPLAQNPSRLVNLLVRTSATDPLTLLATIRGTLQQVDPQVPLYGATTLDERMGNFLNQRRFQTSLLIGFAAVALVMAAIGIYGLIQYSIAARTHEIGIRMAVGAQAGTIFRMVIGEGLKLSLIGLALGLVGALWLARAGSSLLFGITATDPLTFVAASLLLIAVAAAACFFPARRAMKVEPVIALRQV